MAPGSMFGIRFLVTVSLFCLLGCTSACVHRAPKVIVVQPLGNFPAKLSQKIIQQIKTVYEPALLAPPQPIPRESYYPPRQRFRAEKIIKYFRPSTVDTILLAIMEEDISTTKDAHKDWGVMGLAYTPGNAAVVSTFRLSKATWMSNATKWYCTNLAIRRAFPTVPKKPATCVMPKEAIAPTKKQDFV